MFHQYYKTKTLPILIVILFFVFIYAPVNTQAQGLYKLKDSRPPGGGVPSTSIENTRDKTSTIWVLMGITTGLVLFYKFFIQKKEPKKPGVDSTKTTSIMFKKFINPSSVAESIKDNESPIPFRLYLGVRRDDPVYNKKTYVLGVSFNL